MLYERRGSLIPRLSGRQHVLVPTLPPAHLCFDAIAVDGACRSGRRALRAIGFGTTGRSRIGLCHGSRSILRRAVGREIGPGCSSRSLFPSCCPLLYGGTERHGRTVMPDPCVNLRELELPKPSDAVSRHSLGLDPAVDGVTRNPKMRGELFD